MPDIHQVIQEQLQQGHSLTEVIAFLRGRGYQDSDIDAAMRESLSAPSTSKTSADDTPTASPPPEPSLQTPAQTKPKPKSALHIKIDIRSLDATKAFLIIGALLIISAVVIILTSQWNNIGPFTKVLLILIPDVALFGIAARLNSSDRYEDIADATLGTGLLIFPFAVATTLYQMQVIPTIDALLATVSGLVAYVLAIIIEFGFKKSRFSLFSLVYLYATMMAALLYYKVETLPALWIMLILSILVSAFGTNMIFNEADDGTTYATTGIIAVAFISLFIMIDTLTQYGNLSIESKAVIVSLFSFVYLGLSMTVHAILNRLNNRALYGVKRLLEELAPIILILPYISVGFSDVGFMVIAIAFSFLYIFGSIRLRLKTLLPLGTVGLVVGILDVSNQLFSQTLGWPIMLFIAGFAFIGLGFLVRRIMQMRRNETEFINPWGIGEDPAMVKHGTQAPHISPALGCLLLILALWLLPSLFWLLFSHSFYGF